MPSIPLRPPPPLRTSSRSPLPQLLHTPMGLALVELQGTINFPTPPPPMPGSAAESTPVGRLVFPDYAPDEDEGEGEGKWTKRVWLYIGEHQRLTGEVRRLERAIGVVGKKGRADEDGADAMQGVEAEVKVVEELEVEELEVRELVRWKMVFSGRPEPVGGIDVVRT